MQCSVFIATSLDGFIARPNGAIDWLLTADAGAQGEDHGYQAFFASVDALVMGRKTYESALTFAEWPYTGKRVVVLSQRPVPLPAHLATNVESMTGTPAEIVHHLTAQGARRAYIDGGLTIQGFLRAGLITDLVITTIPILLGAGRPLFGALDHDVHLQHVETRAYPHGFVQSTYRVLPTPPV